MSRINANFESVLEKLARITSKNTGVTVIIEGNKATTNGNRIVLPMLEDVEEEVRADLLAFLDHQVAHVKYTDFDAMDDILNRFHSEFANMIEDVRIEGKLPEEYPGTASSFMRLNSKWISKIEPIRDTLPWPIRTMLALREIHEGKKPRIDTQIAPIVAAALAETKNLRSADTTQKIVDQTAEIIRIINLAREELGKGMPPCSDEEMEEAMKQLGGEPPIELDPDRKNKDKKKKEAKGKETLDPSIEKPDESGKGEDDGDSDTDKQNGEENQDGSGKSGDDGEAGESEDKQEGKGKGKNKDSEQDKKDGQDGAGAGGEESEDSEKKDGKGKNQPNTNLEKEESNTSKAAAEKKESAKMDKIDGRPESMDGKHDMEEEASAAQELLERIVAAWKDSAAEAAMLKAKVGEENRQFDSSIFSSESYMESILEKAVRSEPDAGSDHGYYYGQESKIDPSKVSVPYSREYDEVIDFNRKGNREEYAKRKRQIMRHINPIKQHLERVLKVKENARLKTEEERGRLNTRRLATMCIDPNYRTPFAKNTKTDTSNVAVSLVIDCSGSMGGSKIEMARQTGLALGESLKALNMHFEMVGFNTSSNSELANKVNKLSAAERKRFNRFGTTLRLMVFKSFDVNDLSGICKAEAGGANADGESIVWAAKRLAQQPQKRKIMIVLSDGQPAYENTNSVVLAGDLKRVVGMLPKAGIEVIGVGINTDDPKLFYPDWVEVNDINKLGTAVMNKLSKLLEKGWEK